MFFFLTMIIAGASAAFPVRKKRDVFLGVAAMGICAFVEFLWYCIFRGFFLSDPYVVIWDTIHENDILGIHFEFLYTTTALYTFLLCILPHMRLERKGQSARAIFEKISMALLSIVVFAVGLHFQYTFIYTDVYNVQCCFFLCLLLYVAILVKFFQIEKYYEMEKQQKEYEDMEQIRMRQLEFYQSKMLAEDKLRKLTHDMGKYMEAFEKLKKEQPGEIQNYIEQLSDSMQDVERHVVTGNALVDTILMEKEKEAHSKEIDFQIVAQTTRLSEFKSVYLCSIFANALDNAIEACDGVPRERAFVKIDITEAGAGVYILFENSYRENRKRNYFETSKEDKFLHGFGLKNIQNGVEKCGGNVSIHMGKGVFSLSILLNGMSK
ncbi:MAG: ATP-binding protein [Eubacterium sp.]